MKNSANQGLRLVFAGTPDFAAHHLQALINSQHTVVAVYTQPDRPAGRGKKLKASAVKKLALSHELPVFQPKTLKDDKAQATLAAHNADVMIVVAYGLLLPKAVLDIPPYGCLNVHGSLLPRWRGAAPMQRAILGENDAGDTKTGITIMQMDVGLDTGDMLYKSEYAIKATETTASLHDELMVLGADALLETLSQLHAGQLKPKKQDDSLATYAEKISKEEAKINWSLPAEIIDRRIRAYKPFPVAYGFLGDKRIKFYQAVCKTTAAKSKKISPETQAKKVGEILSFTEEGLMIACGEQALLVQQLQIPGKKVMAVKDMVNGYSDIFVIGQCFE